MTKRKVSSSYSFVLNDKSQFDMIKISDNGKKPRRLNVKQKWN